MSIQKRNICLTFDINYVNIILGCDKNRAKPNQEAKEVLTFIKKYIVENGYPPSVREICNGLDLSSPATVHTHLNN